jgi:predicted tellurium resistance membrane protein TerC
MLDLLSLENLIALLSLTGLEIVLGIDNIVFIAILTGKLAPSVQPRARRLGLGAAMIMRILLLLTIAWIMQLTQPLFTMLGHEVSGRDLILLGGGLFLIAKSTREIHEKLEAHVPTRSGGRPAASFGSCILQIMILDIVFSLDSVITAVGMAQSVPIMIAAIVIAVIVMMIFSSPISTFVNRHPTIKVLALAFLLLIGVMLVLEGFGTHVEKGYIYFAMAFSLAVEILNLRLRRGLPTCETGGCNPGQRTVEHFPDERAATCPPDDGGRIGRTPE